MKSDCVGVAVLVRLGLHKYYSCNLRTYVLSKVSIHQLVCSIELNVNSFKFIKMDYKRMLYILAFTFPCTLITLFNSKILSVKV